LFSRGNVTGIDRYKAFHFSRNSCKPIWVTGKEKNRKEKKTEIFISHKAVIWKN